MATTEIALDPKNLAELAELGFKLTGLGRTRQLDDGSTIEGPSAVISRVVSAAFLKVGAFCCLDGGTLNNVEIGRYCSIADGVMIGSHEHPIDWLTSSRTAYHPEVHGWGALMTGEAGADLPRHQWFPDSCPLTVLESDVWIGHGAFIKSGVRLGTGAIIGARATVVKDVPPYAIVVGTPGRVLRLRFPDPVVERLLKSRWWQYSIYDLFNAPLDDIERALDVIEEAAAKGLVAPYKGPRITAADLSDPARALAALARRPHALAS